MSALPSECMRLVAEELDVLQAIYPDYISVETENTLAINFSVPIDLNGEVKVLLEDMNAPASTDRYESQHPLTQLPPVVLSVSIPENYPVDAPPTILSLATTSEWLMKITELRDALLKMWTPGELVLSTWVECILSGDVLRLLNMYDKPGLLCLPHPNPQTLHPILLAHSDSHDTSRFHSTSFACSICLTDFKGAQCIRLNSCQHVFCSPGLTDFWRMCIAEGDIPRVGCPDPVCVKEGVEASEDVVTQVLSEIQIQRWRWLRAKRTVEQDPTMMHCPRPQCQAPVPTPPLDEREADSAWNRLRNCPECGCSFFSVCKRTWHGPLSLCFEPSANEILKEYLSLDPNDRKLRTGTG